MGFKSSLRTGLLLLCAVAASLLIFLGVAVITVWGYVLFYEPASVREQYTSIFLQYTIGLLLPGCLLAWVYNRFRPRLNQPVRVPDRIGIGRRGLSILFIAAGFVLGGIAVCQLVAELIQLRSPTFPFAALNPLGRATAGLLMIWIGTALQTTRHELEELHGVNAPLGATAPQMPPKATPWEISGQIAGSAAALWMACTIFSRRTEFDPLLTLSYTGVIWIGIFLLIALHEVGHLTAGRLVGMTPLGMDLGTGALICTFQRWGMFIRVHAIPWSGRAHILYQTEKHFRLRELAMAAGGPIAHALGVLLLTAVYITGNGSDISRMAGIVALIGGLLLLVGSLFPHVQMNGNAVDCLNDAFRICTAFRLSDRIIGRLLLNSRIYSANQIYLQGKYREAATYLEKYQSLYTGEVLYFLVLGDLSAGAGELQKARVCYARALEIGELPQTIRNRIEEAEIFAMALAGDYAETRKRTLACISREDVSTNEKTGLLDRLACLPFMYDKWDYLAEADDWSQRALELDPSLTLQGTRGSLLVELGRPAEARPLLEKVKAESALANDQGITSLYLGILEAEAGNSEQAERLFSDAREKHPSPWLIARIEKCTAGKEKSPTT